jgi:hypothetical protein
MTPTSQPGSDRPTSRGLAILWSTVFFAGATLYAGTCQRGAAWQDSGKHQYRVMTGDYRGDLGLALSHPLYIAAGRALRWLPLGGLPTRLNAFSGIGLAVALGNLACLLAWLTGRYALPAGTAAMLAVAHCPWWLATVAETYPWSLAAFTGELWLLAMLLRRPRWNVLAGLALVNGLHLAIHNLALLATPVYAVAVVAMLARRRLAPWTLAPAAALWVLGASPLLAMTVELAWTTSDPAGAMRSMLFGRYADDVLNTRLSGTRARWMGINLMLASLSYASAVVPLAIVGLARLPAHLGRATAWSMIAVLVIEAAFFVRYSVPDQFMFMLPTLAMVFLMAGVGLVELASGGRRWRALAWGLCAGSVLLAPLVYAAAPAVLRRVRPSWASVVRHPFRDEARYWLVPWKHDERSAEQFARRALRLAGPDGIVLAGESSRYPLRVVQLRDGLSPGVESLPPGAIAQGASRGWILDALAEGRTLWVVPPARLGGAGWPTAQAREDRDLPPGQRALLRVEVPPDAPDLTAPRDASR